MVMSKNMLDIEDSTKLSMSSMPSVLNADNIEAQLYVKCTEASLVGIDLDEAKPCSNKQIPIPASWNLKMLTSEVCHKNFVIIDQCDKQSTVILHPSWLQSPLYGASLEPVCVPEVSGFPNSFQGLTTKPLEAMFSLHSSQTAPSPAFIEVIEPSLQVQLKGSRFLEGGLIDSVGYEACDLEKRLLRTTEHLEFEQGLSSEFHEDTEEINALLGSDLLSSDNDLSSTGHSPIDAASNDHRGITFIGVMGRKRKLEDLPVDEADDADSASGELTPGALTPSRSLGSCSALHSCENGLKRAKYIGGCEASWKIRQSSKFHTLEPVIADQDHHESKQCPGTIGKGGPRNSSKRVKIKSNVQQLKSVIPGGQLLDTAGVLGRTIQYVKSLQSRLRDLEAAREPVWPMQQIG